MASLFPIHFMGLGFILPPIDGTGRYHLYLGDHQSYVYYKGEEESSELVQENVCVVGLCALGRGTSPPPYR